MQTTTQTTTETQDTVIPNPAQVANDDMRPTLVKVIGGTKYYYLCDDFEDSGI